MRVRQQLVVLVVLHADLQHPQLDRGRGGAGLQRAHRLAVAQIRQVLTVDAEQDVA